MAVHSVQYILSGLEFSPTPHFLVEGDQVVGATSSCAELLGCEQPQEIQNSSFKVWFVDYDMYHPDDQIVKVRHKAGTFFQALVSTQRINLGNRSIQVISINHLSEIQMQKTVADLNLLSHVLNPSMTQLTDFLDSASSQHSPEAPRLRRLSVDLTDGVKKFRFFKILEYGSLPVETSQFNPSDLLMEIVDAKLSLHADRWEIYTHIPMNMDNVVLDQEKLRFIIDEILQNAIVHNHAGRIDVTAVDIDEAETRNLVIIVQDNGRGFVWPLIASEKGATSPVKRSDSGGVGLSICSTLAKTMHGSLSITSREGKGSTIKLALPYYLHLDPLLQMGEDGPVNEGSKLERSSSEPVHKSPLVVQLKTKLYVSGASTPSAVKKKDPVQFNFRALIVEDNLVSSKILIRILEGFGLTCEEAKDGLEAVVKVHKNPLAFDLIFMDLLMPLMGGLEATGIIKRICQEKGRDIPIFACTANSEDDQQCIDAKMAGVFHKPVKKDALRQLLLSISNV